MSVIKLYEFASAPVRKRMNEQSAPEQAKMLGLIYAGWGKWKDKSGKVVAKTVQDQLVRVTPGEEAHEKNRRSKQYYTVDGQEVSRDELDAKIDATPFGPEKEKLIRTQDAGGHWKADPENEPHPDIEVGRVPHDKEQYEAFDSFIKKNGGAMKAISIINSAASAAFKSGDKKEGEKGLALAKAFKKVIPALATGALENAYAAGALLDDHPGALENFEEYMNRKFEDHAYQTFPATQISPAEYDLYDWSTNISPEGWASLYDAGERLAADPEDDVATVAVSDAIDGIISEAQPRKYERDRSDDY